jgi:hypothetical protein
MKHKTLPIILLSISLLTFFKGCQYGSRPTPIQLTTITVAPIHMPTFSPISTIPSASTLVPKDAYARLQMLLTDTTNCHLPCWLGITPGETDWQDVTTQLMMFSSIASNGLDIGSVVEKGAYGNLLIPFPKDNMAIEIGSSYRASLNTNTVNVIWLDTRAYRLKGGEYDGDVYGYAMYDEILKAYTLSEILSDYGQPSRVFIRSDLSGTPPPGWWGYIIIHIWYPDQGVFLEYKTVIDGAGNTYRFCPSNAFISGTLIPPGHANDYHLTCSF